MVDFFCTDNPDRDAGRYSDYCEELEKRFRAGTPKCFCCENPVGEVGDEYFKIDDMYFCEDCIRDSKRDIDEL